jgi:DNA-binding IclR family transcriptional regulator
MPKTKKKEKQSAYKSIYRTAAILSCLNKGVTTVTGISNTLKINKATIYRLLQAMNEAGFTLRNTINRQYYIGPLITRMAENPSITHGTLVLLAANEMDHLAELSGELITLSVLIGVYRYNLHEIPSIHDVQIVIKKSLGMELHAGATSRVLLSQINNKDMKKAINSISFTRLTERSITNRDSLLEQMKKDKKNGYALGCSERAVGAMSISVPIKNYVIPVAIGILGMEDRMKPRSEEYINVLLKTAARIEANISLLSGEKDKSKIVNLASGS